MTALTVRTRLSDARPRLLDPAWPVVLITVAMPVAYVAGIGTFVWLLPAVAFGVPLLARRSLRTPGFVLPLVGLALWIPLTAINLPGAGALPAFLYRWTIWISTIAVALWLCNTSTRIVPTERIVRLLALLWIVIVGFGYLALVYPSLAEPSLLQRVVPARLASNQFFYDLTVVRFAEPPAFGVTIIPRPAAPWQATNGWGASIALLAPFFIVSWLSGISNRRRIVGWIIVAAALVPISVSANRGMALSLAIGLLYYAVRRALAGEARVLVAILTVFAMLAAAFVLTPLGSVVGNRLSQSEESTTAREDVYRLALEGSLESPLLGHGAPLTRDRPPPIGTHGMVWYLMYSHGFFGLALFVLALLAMLASSWRARTPTALWAHVTILMFTMQVLYYGLLPHVVVLAFAAGIAWRENHPVEASEAPA